MPAVPCLPLQQLGIAQSFVPQTLQASSNSSSIDLSSAFMLQSADEASSSGNRRRCSRSSFTPGTATTLPCIPEHW
ncbi:unnamed protein product [Gongylonema pulchrum]|uniref:Uncharacterized protein n=1 Tax=Gongylonema pulchrum TaxID=637853 RepID=A0A183DPL0_9BILA|nr:unnamed protein product [Gongylonema pulchrum]